MSALLLGLALASPALAHGGHAASAAWTVCEGSALGDRCAWEDERGDLYRGTCRRMAETLACVRNRPIVPASRAAAPVAWLALVLLGGWVGRR